MGTGPSKKGRAKNINKKMAEIKYPRVMVSNKRHAKLSKEAKKRGLSLQDLAEEKFKAADKAESVKTESGK